ncbi:HAMP domain-containing sensor histidine kinase [Halorarum halobium]|uniref:HAMP domain-containing sensor histidine kinase n=1 Tax=Halorarum halobium TaxID=3075121 RepID=UPI0028AE86A5|nr:HAMP domain-containing sensor histidine kinase [Halobaculum sp. XH14]
MATDEPGTTWRPKGGLLGDRLRQFGVFPTIEPPNPERGKLRALACGTISLSGVALLTPTASQLFAGGATVGTGLAVLGTVVAIALVAVGGFLYRSTMSTRNTIRIAAWNFLGIAVLGAVMLALFAYQRADGGVVQSPTFVLGTLLAIGAGAHIIIGVYDARRVRAEQLARERRRTAVLNRALRHNIRNGTNVILGHAELLVDAVDDGTAAADSAETLRTRADSINDLADKAREMALYTERPTDAVATEAAEIVAGAETAAGEANDEATVADGTVDDVLVEDDGRIALAVKELVENAALHGGAAPTVEVRGRATDGWSEFTVVDDGPGVPPSEREVVLGDRDLTAVEHGSGLGLWIARAVAETIDGEFTLGDGPDGGTVATLRVPAA